MRLAKSILPFLVITTLFLLTGLILISITDKTLLHLSANAFVGGTADTFFKNYTHIGDGVTIAIIIPVICLFDRKKFVPNVLLGMTTFALSGLIAQFFKRIVFYDYFRPVKAIGAEHLNLIEGVDLHGSFSFPSGHSTVSFALFIFLAYLFRSKRYLQVLFAIMAILAAYSRVHISQHFIQDIIAGAILGVGIFFLVYWLFSKYLFKSKLKLENE